ncbi:MAG: hypothetical protein JO325_06675 [Solirubrobacterales bacterium]|nr:hypothetical protein [Solirubrobacterales bacterium]
MTGKADFTEQEWETVREGPTAAGFVVITASKGGTFKETFALAKAYAEARQQHGSSELVDAIVSAKPDVDRHMGHSPEEVKSNALQHVRDAIAVLSSKATPEEVDDYRRFVLTVSDHVAKAHREDGVEVSPGEQAVIGEITQALGGDGSQ